MDKNKLFEGYEFMQSNSTESVAVPGQFFVVQDDGTFLISKQIQYVTEGPETKNSPESCSVYEIGSEQFFVNVDNSSNLVPVTDQYVLPEGDSNLFTNNYLLQTDYSTNNDQTPINAPSEYKQTSPHISDTQISNIHFTEDNAEINADESLNKAADCTEITLNDDQYHMLEQKGWILLESNDKIFVLNPLGLHDITANSSLIQKLRNETENTSKNVSQSSFIHKSLQNQHENLEAKNDQKAFEFEAQNVTGFTEYVKNEESVDNAPLEQPDRIQSVIKRNDANHNISETEDTTTNVNNEPQDYIIEVFKEPNSKSLRISTKLIFKDIPKRIVLGKTTNGKRLVVKTVDQEKPVTLYEKIVQNQKMNDTDLSEAQFLSLLQQTLQSYQNTYYADDISSADSVITQLFKVPTLRKIIVDQSVVITKVKGSKDASGKYYKSKPTLITGKVILTNDKFVFVQLPNLLQFFFQKPENNDSSNSNNDSVDKRNEEMPIVHIHITETIGEDNVIRVHVNLTKRQISADSVLDHRKLRKEKTYACASCAAIFATPSELTQHQEAQCTETEDNLMIDTDGMNDTQEYYSVSNNGKKKMYSCLLCKVTFPRFSSCMKHVKSHYITSNKRKSDNENDDEHSASKIDKSQVFKCKMCPAAFFHPSTLSKHIVTKHIKLKSS